MRIFLIEFSMGRDIFPNVMYVIPPIPLRRERLFQIDHRTNPFMFGTLDSSCSQVSRRRIISTSLGIQLNLGPLFQEKPRKFQARILSVSNCYFLIFLWFLSLIMTFLFLINAHFPPFLASFTF